MNAQIHPSITVITTAPTRPPVSFAGVVPATASCLTAKRATTSTSVQRHQACAARSVRTPLAPTFVNAPQDFSESRTATAAVRTVTSHPTLSSATAITLGTCQQTGRPILWSCRAWPVWWPWTLIVLTSVFIGLMWAAGWLRGCPLMAATERWSSMVFYMGRALLLTG